MKSTASIVANQQWREQEGLEPDPTREHGKQPDARGERVGPVTPTRAARLADMDADGVEVSSSYCEVSSFRYLYLIENGWRESTRAFNSALGEFAVGRPEAPDRLVPDPDPRHRRRGRRGAMGGVGRMQVVAASGVPCRARPARLLGRSGTTPLFAAIQETGLPICCHIGMNTQLDDLARRDPTPQKGIFVPMVAAVGGGGVRACGSWAGCSSTSRG